MPNLRSVSRRGWLWLIGVATAFVGVVLVALDGPLWDAGGPGIVGFELAGSEERADDIRTEWGEEGRDSARLSLWIDFLYLAGYGAFWALAAAAIRDRTSGRLARALRLAIVTAPLAAACDVVENVALLLVLGGHGGAIGPPVAAAFAVAKFALIGFSVGSVLVALALRDRRVTAGLAAGAVAFVAVSVVVIGREEHGADPVLTALADGRIRAAISGDPRNPPLLLVHGFSVDHHWWDPVVEALSRDFYVVRPDLVGHGASEKPRERERYAMEAQAATLASAARSVPGLDGRGYTVVGHSMGGVVATALAEARPELVERLMIVGTGPDVGHDHRGLNRQTPAFLPVSGHLIRAFTPRDWIRAEYERGLEPEVDLTEPMIAGIDRTTWPSFHGSVLAVPEYTEDAPIDERVRRLRIPFAALFGADDRQAETIDRYRRIPGARVIELPGLGHSPQIDRPGLAARLIADWARLG